MEKSTAPVGLRSIILVDSQSTQVQTQCTSKYSTRQIGLHRQVTCYQMAILKPAVLPLGMPVTNMVLVKRLTLLVLSLMLCLVGATASLEITTQNSTTLIRLRMLEP